MAARAGCDPSARGSGFSTRLIDLLAQSGMDVDEPSAPGRMMAA